LLNLGEGIIQIEGFEEDPPLPETRRHEGSLSSSLAVSSKEQRSHPLLPVNAPWLQTLTIVRTDSSKPCRGPPIMSDKSRLHRLVEGIEHASHITDQGPFNPAITDAASWIPLKVNKHKVLAGVEDLAKVKIAMTAIALHLQWCTRHQLQTSQQGILRLKHLLHQTPVCIGEAIVSRRVREEALQTLEPASGFCPQRLVNRALIQRSVRFPSESPIFLFTCQDLM
jgi:hypothetical protein